MPRVSAHVFSGFDLESDLFILHKCDDGLCFNPEHLFVGTQADNLKDASRKGRISGWKGVNRQRKRNR